jgi:tetratricopeptide (TPR) repeat protein
MNLIGREHQVSVLRAEITRVTQSHGGLVFVTGEAGIGKTTLVTGAVDDARQQGALVLNGSCWNSDSTPGYWPWVQVVRGLRRGVPAAEWAAVGEAAGDGLRVLLGESVGQSADTFELYDAVTTALVSVSHTRPVVVVLDDLHWADPASLRLLEFAAQHTWFERLLVIGTYRDVEAEAPDHPLRPLLLPLLGRATTVSLTGLSQREVGALIRRTAGREPGDDLVAEVHRHTGGNPFFVEQSARLWHSGGSATAVSPGVRDSLQRRLSMLPPPVRELLTGAAVLGREFEREVLAATVAPEPARAEASASGTVDRLLDHAVTARLAVVHAPGRFAFAHDLVRETLYDDLAAADVRRRHADVVRAIDRTPGLADRILPADLARHAYLAGADLDPDRAVDILLAAAQDASNRIAIEEEIGHLRRALERAAAVPRRLVRVGLDLGAALLMNGLVEEGWQRYADAVTAAREVDDDLLIARVALTLTRSERERAPTGTHTMIAALIGEAYRRLVGPVSPADEAALAAAGSAIAAAVPNGVGFFTGSVLHRQSDQDTVARLSDELTHRFVALARANGDDDALRFGLWARHNTIWGLGTARERYELTDEIIAVSRRLNDPVTGHIATSFQWVSLLELGDPRYLERYHAFVAMAERIGMPTATFSSLVDQSIILTLLGRFDEAEKCLNQADESFSHHHAHFHYMAHHLRWALLVMQGRFAETADLLVTIAASEHPCPNLLAAVVALQRGDPPPDTSTDNLQHPFDFQPLTLRVEAQAAAASGDPERCERAHAALLPYSGEWLVSMYGCDISGPVDLWLAILDAASKRWEPAFERFTAALESAERLQSRPWAVEVRVRLAAALRARGGPGDGEAAATVLAAAIAEAAEIGLRHIVAPADPPARATTADARFQLDGQVWDLGFAGHAIHFPDAKGLHDLHHLLSHPGEAVSAVDLLNPAGGDVVRAARSLGGDPVLDDEAKARYKHRLTQLDDEIDRATLSGDTARAATLDHERDALLTELRAAAGLAGRTRRLGDEAERARKTVTARIRDTLRKLDEQHPALAAHLRESVSTGATCVYQPPTPVSWTL